MSAPANSMLSVLSFYGASSGLLLALARPLAHCWSRFDELHTPDLPDLPHGVAEPTRKG